jgi:predicted DNA-binding transcriptional regulator YafY
MNRIDRLSAILIQLQSKKVVRALEVAERFEISLRTVYRDIRALEEAGVPIGAEAGVGYFLMEGYNLPPVKFSKEEAGAILMASKLAEAQTDKSIRKNLNDALFKIRAVLKLEEKDYLESIENSIEVLHLPEELANSKFPDHFLSDIQLALAQKKVINFDYYSNYNDAFTNRDVEPLSLCYYGRHWHLVAYCRLRNDLRDFRSDRIMKLSISEKVFEKDHANYSGYLSSIIQGSDLQEVVIRFSNKVSRYINEQRYFLGYIDSEKSDGYEDMKFMTADLEMFARWLLQFSGSIKVLSPDLLRDKLIYLFELGLSTHTQLQGK